MPRTPRREFHAFLAVLAALVALFFHESLFLGKVLSPADVLFATAGFSEAHGPDYVPRNRLLIDPVLQFEPWIAFNREQLRAGRLPLWNPYVGCGAPHLANGQSAVFDPFLLIAYLGPMPTALAWVSAARLLFAGAGMYLLARSLGLGTWGRWFAGLTFPFTGFLVVWLLYPVTNAAVWLPWLMLATKALFDRPGLRRSACLALAVGGCLLGGHVQTSAHALLLTGAFALWLWGGRLDRGGIVALGTWKVGILLGILIAAIEIVPLGFYLAESPVWADRAAERKSPISLERPRLLDAACLAIPYAYGSQRRGHPNIARALSVHNLNESAGGFAGLATLVWLAPLAWSSRKGRPIVGFLIGAALFGLLGSLRFPPVDNLLRAIPVLNVTDNRRLSLWVAFALSLLGGIGLDGLGTMCVTRAWRWWGLAWWVAALLLLVPVFGLGRFEGRIRQQSREHYAKAAAETPGADPEVYRARADRQTRDVVKFIPRYYATAAVQLFALGGMLGAIRCLSLRRTLARPLLFGVVLADLIGFGFGLNPAISRGDGGYTPPLVDFLRSDPRIAGGRVLALGAELPPNAMMRFGIRDVRNYDSVELSSTLEWLDPIFEPGGTSRTSRREVTWEGVRRGLDRLRESGVRAVVGASPPPGGMFEEVERVGPVWVARVEGRPIAAPPPEVEAPGYYAWGRRNDSVKLAPPDGLVVREIAAPGWKAYVDGAQVDFKDSVYPWIRIKAADVAGRVELRYDPEEVRVALISSVFALILTLFALTRSGDFRSTRIMTVRLGRTRATGLRSKTTTLPDLSTGE